MTAVIRGDYSYHTIPASVVKTVQRYIPSLLTIKDNMPEPHNNFQFDICLENAEVLSKLFQIPLELYLPASLKGYFNDGEEKLHVEGHFRNSDTMEHVMIRAFYFVRILLTGSNVHCEAVC